MHKNQNPEPDWQSFYGSYVKTYLERAVKTPKVYFRDTGLASYLTRWLAPDILAWGGAVISMCPEPGKLRENVLEIPAWYI